MSEYVVINGNAKKIVRKETEGSLLKLYLDDAIYREIYAKEEWICKGVVSGRLTEEDDEIRQ